MAARKTVPLAPRRPACSANESDANSTRKWIRQSLLLKPARRQLIKKQKIETI
jgi:hypothetical protein